MRSISLIYIFCLSVALYAGTLAQTSGELRITVTDTQHQALVGARCTLSRNGTTKSVAVTDQEGFARFTALSIGPYDLRVEKEGFALFEKKQLAFDGAAVLFPVTLQIADVSASVTVKGQAADAASVDNGATVASGSLQRSTVERLPLATKRVDDAIPLLPGVIRSSEGEISINGASEARSAFHVNGLNVADPASGNFRLNLPVDAVESVQVFRHPYSAEFGQFTGGLTEIATRRGGDKWHFEINDFLPDLRFVNGGIRGIRDDSPHMNFNGPLIKDKLFLAQSLGYTISKTPVRGLTYPDNETIGESQSYFTQLDMVLGKKRSETLTIGYFPERQSFVNLDFFRPKPVTPNYKQKDLVVTLHDHYAIAGGLLETSVSVKRFEAHIWGQGTSDETLTPVGESGNYFAKQDRRSSRVEFFSFYETKPLEPYWGEHRLKTGVNISSVTNRMTLLERPVNVRRLDNTLASRTTFENAGNVSIANRTYTGFLQDRWLLKSNLGIDAGLRFEDQRIAEGKNIAPRGGFAWSPFAGDRTVIRGGVGYFYDKVPLNIRAFQQYPIRTVTRFAADGSTIVSQTRFENVLVDDPSLIPLDFHRDVTDTGFVPVNLTWNIQVDHTVSDRLSLRANYTNSHTNDLYLVTPETDFFGRRAIVLTPSGQASYWSLEMTARVTLAKERQFFVSYVRSRSRGDLNEFNGYFGDYGFPIIRGNHYSNLSTDVPNRLIGWGTISLPRKINIAPIIEWRSGFPFSIVNENQSFVGTRNTQRLPNFFSIDAEISKDVRVTKKYSIRLSLKGFNLTNHFNPRNVRNNTADPQFGAFINSYRRYFTGGFDILF